MNSFIPQNPIVVLGPNGEVANNIDPELTVVKTSTVAEFEEASRGVTFDSRHPHPQTQVLAHRK
jgi:hypothetical protein